MRVIVKGGRDRGGGIGGAVIDDHQRPVRVRLTDNTERSRRERNGATLKAGMMTAIRMASASGEEASITVPD